MSRRVDTSMFQRIEPHVPMAEQRASRRKALLGEQAAELSIEQIRQEIETAKTAAAEGQRKAKAAEAVREIRQRGGTPQQIVDAVSAVDPAEGDRLRALYQAEADKTFDAVNETPGETLFEGATLSATPGGLNADEGSDSVLRGTMTADIPAGEIAPVEVGHAPIERPGMMGPTKIRPITARELSQMNAKEALAKMEEQSRLKREEAAEQSANRRSELELAASLRPEPPAKPRSNLQREEMLVNGKPEVVLIGVDPDDAETFQKVFLRGQDVTDKASYYRPPPQQAPGVSPGTGMESALSIALQRATMGMPQTRRNQSIRAANSAIEAGDEAQAREIIRQAALEGEPVAQRAQIQGRREVITALDGIEEALKKVPQNLLVGTIEDVARKLGTSTNTEYVKIGNRLKLLNQSYRRSMSGAAFSIPESQEYASILPGYKDTAPVNAALISSLREAFAANDSLYWRNKLGPGWSDAESVQGGSRKIKFRASDGRVLEIDSAKWADVLKRDPGAKQVQ